MTDHDEPDDGADEDESLIDELRDTGVGLDDPNIVGQPTPLVDEQIAPDAEPQV